MCLPTPHQTQDCFPEDVATAIERACYEMDTACLDFQFEILQRKRGWPKETGSGSGASDRGTAGSIFSPTIPGADQGATPSVRGSCGVGGGVRRGVTKSASGRKTGGGLRESGGGGGGGDARIRLGGAAANRVGGAAAIVAVVIKKEHVREACFFFFCNFLFVKLLTFFFFTVGGPIYCHPRI